MFQFVYAFSATIPVEEAELSPRDPRDVLSVEILAYCCTNNANRSRVSLRSTFSNCRFIPQSAESFVHASFNYRRASMRCSVSSTYPVLQPCWCQQDCIWDEPTSTTTSVVDDTAYSSTSAPSWTQMTAVDGHKFSVVIHRHWRWIITEGSCDNSSHQKPPRHV